MTASAVSSAVDPPYECATCPRLRDYILRWRDKEPEWFNGPVETWSEPGGSDKVKLLIVGLAPGLRGANRTGRPFTGDFAGDLLYETLLRFGFATGSYGASPEDSLQLRKCAITNAVRCVPPDNKPVGAEINNCRQYLESTIASFKNLRAIVTLGKISHDSTVRTLGQKPSQAVFGHGAVAEIADLQVFSSYHCSRYNTNTRRLTPEKFQDVFRNVSNFLEK